MDENPRRSSQPDPAPTPGNRATGHGPRDGGEAPPAFEVVDAEVVSPPPGDIREERVFVGDLGPRSPTPDELANRTIPAREDPPPVPPAPPRIRIVSPSPAAAPPAATPEGPPPPLPPPRPAPDDQRGRAPVPVRVDGRRAPPPPTHEAPALTAVQFRAHDFKAHDDRTAGEVTVTVVIPPDVRDALVEHAAESGRKLVEVGGFLLGTVERVSAVNPQTQELEGPAGYLVTVTDAHRIRSRSSSMSHVQFDEHAWADLNAACDARYTREGKVRLGWYHTHPNQGIFFSDQDLDGHKVWRKPFQFGLVIDPRVMQCGLFHWKDYPADPNADPGVIRECLSDRLLFWLRPPRPAPPPPPSGGVFGARSERPSAGPAPAEAPNPGYRPPPPPPPRGPVNKVLLGATLFVLGLIWALVLQFSAVSLPVRGGSLLGFDPTYVILAGVLEVYVFLRLWNVRWFVDDPEADPDPTADLVPWRVLAAIAALAGAGFGLVYAGAAAGAAGVVAYAVVAGLVLLEAWAARLFHDHDPPDGRVPEPAAGWAVGGGVATAARALGRGIAAVTRPMFGTAINPVNIAIVLVVIWGAAKLLFDHGASRLEIGGQTVVVSNWIPGLMFLAAGLALLLLAELVRTGLRQDRAFLPPDPEAYRRGTAAEPAPAGPPAEPAPDDRAPAGLVRVVATQPTPRTQEAAPHGAANPPHPGHKHKHKNRRKGH